MNEEAFNTMYILAQKDGYKKTPEEFKTLLNSNQEALNTMYSIAQREGYKKTPEEFKILLGVTGVEGEPVNFTEGSGEQQEQPAEPLEKPIVDVDRFSVPETNEYLSGARETAAKELRETEKILSGVAKSPTKVLDYKSYDPIQLDSAMSDIDKKLEQTNFILSTRGLTQPQRTTAKKERDRLKEEKAIATVVRVVENNNYGMLDDAKEAIAFVGPNRIVGKELSKEYEKLESRVNNDINEKFVDIDFNKLTEIDNQGIERADVAKISDLSDEIATSMAEGDEAVRQLVYEKLFDRAENNRFINESIKRASENEVIQKLQSDKLSSFQDTNESAIKFKAEASSSAKKINDKTEIELNAISQDYTKNVKNYFSDLQSKVSQGLMTAEDAQKDYDSYNQELYKNLKEQQNLIVNESESAIKGINELYSQKIQKGYEEFSKNNPLSQEERDLLSTEYGKIYEEIRDDEFKKLKGQETLDYIKYGGTGLAFDFGKSLNSTLSRAISGAGTYFGSPSLVEIGDEMNTSFSVADEPLENWSDLANIPAVTKSIGRLAGSAASSIIVGSAVSASTAGLGTVPAMALVAATGFVTESIDMAGNIKRDVIRETGSLLKGEQAAGAMWEAQMGNWWTYLGDGLPFVSKALKFIPSKTGRILTAGGESVATETPQEILQTSQEQKIMESVRSGEEISAKGFMELITPELAKSTFLEVAPGSLFLGGGSRVITEVRMQGQANQIVKDLIDNINLNGVDKNQSFIKQKIFSSINRHGKNFTNSWLSTLQENGVITEEQLTELYTFSKTAEGFSRNIKNTNLTDEQQQTYFGLSHRANELFDKADAITDDKVLKSSLTQEANELKKNAQSFLSNPETGGSFVTVKIGKSPALVLTESEAIEFVTNNPYVVLPESGVDIVARNADEFGGILEQMAKGVEAGIEDLKSIDDYGKQQSEEGRLSDVDNTLTKINNAEYINDSEIDAGIEQIFDEVDRVDGLDISDNAKESIKQQLFSISETLDNYEFRTKTETRKVTPEQPVEGRAETKREIPKKSTSKAEIPGVGTVNLTFTGRNTISITPKGQEGTTARVTTFTFPENFLYTNEQGDFTALVIEDAEGNEITINDPEIGVPLAINNIIAETAAVPTEVVEEFVTEEINYIKERKEAAPEASTQVAPTEEQKLKDVSEGKVVTFTYPNEQSIPNIFKDRVTSTTDVTGKSGASKTTYRVTISQSEADYLLAQEKVSPTTETAETTTTTEGVETTTELSEEQVSEINRILGLDESERKSQRQGRTKRDNQRLDKVGRAIELLKQSLSEVMPNIVIYVAEDSDAFAVAANEQEYRKQDRSNGFFTRVDGKYVIILNPDSADVTTVFHEGLHAVLVAAGLPNTMARAVTTRMVEAVKKTATKKLQKELNDFTEMYKTLERSEEYIAELIGILASNYNEQNNETKSIIRRWLQKLAEMLGLKPKGVSLSTVGLNNTDAATIDALNFVAKRMSEGGVLTEQDLTRLVQPGQEAATSLIMEEEIFTPGSQILGGTGIRKSKQAKVEDFDTTPPKVDGVKMIYPEKTSIDDVLEKSGGAAIFINSDGTKVGVVVVNGRELILQGGIDYTFIEQNVKDDIGFAASEDKKISQLKTAASELIAERDRKNPEHKGKPIAVFVASQNGETMLGEWYAAEYIMEGLDASIVNKKYKGGLRQAEKDFVKAIKSAKVGKTEDGLRDKKSKDVLLKMVEDGKFKTREGRLDIAKKLASKDFSFGFRVNLNKDLLSNKESASKTGKNVNFKKSLAESGYFLNDFWNRFIDERFLKGIQQERLQTEKGKTVSKKTFSGFFYNPSESLESQINHAKLGVDHAQFNSSFKSQGNFLLDSAYDVNKLFPLMGYPYQEGIDIYNEANNTKFVKETPKRNPLGLVRATIVDKGMISKWLKENGYSNLIVNPYTSIALSLYTGVSEAGETVTRKQKREEAIPSVEKLMEEAGGTNDYAYVTDNIRKQRRTKPAPKKTIKAYKLFRVDKKKPGQLFPLFVKANEEVLTDVWYDAEVGDLTPDGKVKSKIGNLAYRPGWHMGDVPIATHIGEKYNFDKKSTDKSLKKPTARNANHVWAEVEVSADVNWQTEANKRASKTKEGKIIPRTAHITNQIPEDGYYRYKTNPNMTGNWIIGGAIKVNRVLTDKEVKDINDKAGVADLPRVEPIDLSEYGFEEPTIRKRKKKKPKSKVKDAFEWGMQKGVPAIVIKNHLIKLGYTEEEITSGAYDAEKIWNKDGKKVVKWLDYGRRAALSARKFRPQTMFLAKEAMESSISAELRQAKMMAEKLNRAINKYKSQDKRDELIDAVDEFMRDAEERDFWRNELPDDIAQIAEAMRVHIDSLSLKLVDSGVIKAESSRENILGNIGVYMNRSYQVFDNKNWKEEVSEQVITAAQNHLREAYYNSLSGISELDQQLKDGKITESEYNRRKNRILSNKASVKEIMDRDNVSEDEALTMHVDDVIDSILSKKDVNEYILFAQPKVGKKDLSSLKRRKDIPPAIRALMGEYTDPGYNYAMSIFKIANLVENQKYLTKIRDAGLGVWLFEKEAGKKIPEGYEKITFEGDASMNPLDGLYAPKEVAKAFEDIELNRMISGMPKIGWLYGYWLKGVGAVKYNKTILSYGTHAKNVIGNMYFMAQNGYLDPREYQQPFIALVKQFSGKELTAEQEAKMDEWVRAGIIGQGATIGEIKSFFEGEDSFEKALTKRIDKKTDNMLSKVGKGVKKFGQKAQEAYQYEDDMFKIVAYEKEKLNYSKILFDGKSYNQLDVSQQSTVNDYVAEIIKNILPNYGRIGGLGKGLKTFPITGTFISFQIEAYRTAYNTVALAIQEIKGDIPGISETGKKLVQKRGVMRLISIVGFQAFKYGLISLLGIPLIPGDDDDEDGLSEKIRTLLPFWDTNSDISVQEVKPNGNFTYVSISASDPYGSIFKVVNATKNFTKTREGFSEIFGELAGPFVSEDILLNTLMNIKNNENDYGGKIVRNTDTPFEASAKIALQLGKTFEPGGITSTRKIIQSENKLNEALGQFTGFKLHEVKSLEQAGFKFGDIQKKAQESKSAYNSIKYNMDDYETQEDINKVIRASKKAMDEDYQEAVKLYQALISLGVSDRDIKKKMYDYRISAKMRSQIARNSVDVKLNPIKK